jgi:hypothetical protein
MNPDFSADGLPESGLPLAPASDMEAKVLALLRRLLVGNGYHLNDIHLTLQTQRDIGLSGQLELTLSPEPEGQAESPLLADTLAQSYRATLYKRLSSDPLWHDQLKQALCHIPLGSDAPVHLSQPDPQSPGYWQFESCFPVAQFELRLPQTPPISFAASGIRPELHNLPLLLDDKLAPLVHGLTMENFHDHYSRYRLIRELTTELASGRSPIALLNTSYPHALSAAIGLSLAQKTEAVLTALHRKRAMLACAAILPILGAGWLLWQMIAASHLASDMFRLASLLVALALALSGGWALQLSLRQHLASYTAEPSGNASLLYAVAFCAGALICAMLQLSLLPLATAGLP